MNIDSPPAVPPGGGQPDGAHARRYWRTNLVYLAVLLTVWAGVSLGASVVFADALDRIRVGGFPLGFWFAQQGSIYVFLALIVAYVLLMNRLDRRYATRGPG